MSVEFRFDPELHEYWLGPLRLAGTTEVLSAAGMLPDYSGRDEIFRLRGTAIHAAIALDLQDNLDESSLEEEYTAQVFGREIVIPGTAPLLRHHRNWRAEVRFQPFLIEQPLFCPALLYAGSPDSFGTSKDGLILPDWKSGEVEPGHHVQVAGSYLALLERAAQDGLIPGITARDVREARPCLIPLNQENPRPVWIQDVPRQRDYFRAALATHQWRAANLR